LSKRRANQREMSALVQGIHQISQDIFKGGTFYKGEKARSTQGKGKEKRKKEKG
jgi:hypothetical protein